MVPLELLALHKAAVNRYLDVLGFRALEQSAADLDCIAHQTEAVKNWMKASREKGLKEALTERDRPFGKK
jgi:enoyl-CoA hydratase